MVGNLPEMAELQQPFEACMLGKQQRKAFSQESINRSKSLLELVHADLYGKMPTFAFRGSLFSMLLVDDYNRKM